MARWPQNLDANRDEKLKINFMWPNYVHQVFIIIILLGCISNNLVKDTCHMYLSLRIK